MNQQRFYLIILFLVLSIPSCKDKDEIDFDLKRNNIIGEWNMRRFTQIIRADTVYQEYETPVDVCFSFYANGKGFRSFSNFEVDFEWYFQYNPPRVIVADENAVMLSLRNTTVYKINTNQPNLQIWSYDVADSTGIADLFKHTLTFRKK